MKMTRARKAEVVRDLTRRLQDSPNLYLTDFSGIAVKPMTELRRKLREVGVEYRVVKNTLVLQAMAAASVAGVEDVVTGPTALVFVGSDPIGAARVLREFQKENQTLTVKAGLLEGLSVTAEEVMRMATLPSREELLAQVGGAFQAPLQGFVGALTGLLHQFVGAVEALRAQHTAG